MELIARWLSEKAGRKVTLSLPQRGEQKDLLEMCRSNAAEQVAQSTGRTGREAAALDELSRLLGLPKPPAYIEAYDISNLQGGENVAGMVVFEDGRPLKSAYRKFSIKTVEGQDDYGSMREVITRRFQEYFRQKESGEGFGRLPDLILLDGGRGQVSAVRPVLEEMGFGDLPLFGMVKDDKHRTRAIARDGGENQHPVQPRRIHACRLHPGGGAPLCHRLPPPEAEEDGARFLLLEIPGIGQTRAKALLRHFQTVAAIRSADLEELEAAPCMTKPAARAVYSYYHPEKEESGT